MLRESLHTVQRQVQTRLAAQGCLRRFYPGSCSSSAATSARMPRSSSSRRSRSAGSVSSAMRASSFGIVRRHAFANVAARSTRRRIDTPSPQRGELHARIHSTTRTARGARVFGRSEAPRRDGVEVGRRRGRAQARRASGGAGRAGGFGVVGGRPRDGEAESSRERCSVQNLRARLVSVSVLRSHAPGCSPPRRPCSRSRQRRRQRRIQPSHVVF